MFSLKHFIKKTFEAVFSCNIFRFSELKNLLYIYSFGKSSTWCNAHQRVGIKTQVRNEHSLPCWSHHRIRLFKTSVAGYIECHWKTRRCQCRLLAWRRWNSRIWKAQDSSCVDTGTYGWLHDLHSSRTGHSLHRRHPPDSWLRAYWLPRRQSQNALPFCARENFHAAG